MSRSKHPQSCREVPRLLEGTTEGELLHTVLRSAEGDSPSDEQAGRVIEALDRRLEAASQQSSVHALPMRAAKCSITTQRRVLRPSRRQILFCAALLFAGAGAMALQIVQRDASNQNTERASEPIAELPSNMTPLVPLPRASNALPLASTPDVADAFASKTAASSNGSRSSAAPSSSAAAASKWTREVDLLSSAQHALARRDGSTAWSLIAEHRRQFPRGVYREEIERIAIEALLQLGRRGEAEARAERFFAHYPRSAHRPRLEDLLDR